ncbi:RHS repeat-associated core domain-containing protein [Sorangium sp. So ce269]
MARTAPVPNIPAIPGMNPGVFVMGGGAGGGGGSGPGGQARGGNQGAGGGSGGNQASGGQKNAPDYQRYPECGYASHPVDVVTGRAFTHPIADLELPGPLPFSFARMYSSTMAHRDTGLGFGWGHSLGWEVEIRRRKLVVWNEQGVAVDFPHLPEGAEVVGPWGWLLRRDRDSFVVDADDGVLRRFAERSADGTRVRLSAIENRNHQRITLHYEEGRLVRITDSAGRAIRVRSTQDGHIEALDVKNAAHQGRWIAMVTYRYDDAGHLVSATDADGWSSQYAYDDGHRMTSDADRTGLCFHFVYDERGRCVESWGDYPGRPDPSLVGGLPATLADGMTRAKGIHHCRFDYMGDGYTEVADSTQVRRFFGTEHGTLARRVEGGAVTTATYREDGHILSRTDALGATTTFERDVRGRILRTTDPLGGTLQVTRDAAGLPVEIVDPSGAVTRLERDPRGNVLLHVNAAGHPTSFRHDDRGLLSEVVDARGGKTACAYDAQLNCVSVTWPNGAAWRYAYDALGRRVLDINPGGAETRYVYSARGDLVAVTDATGGTTRYTYDGEGHLVEVVDPKGAVTRFGWGGYHKLCSRRDANGHEVRLGYNLEGELVEVTNERGEVHRFERDAAGRLIGEVTFDGRVLRYKNDLLGRPVEIANGLQEKTGITYNAIGQLVSREWPDGSSEQFEYDALGYLIGATSAACEVRFDRDVLGQIVRETQMVGNKEIRVDAHHDPLGDRIRRATSLGHVEEVERDLLGARRRTVLDGRYTIEHGVDLLGREIARTLPERGRIESAFDVLGRLVHRRALGPAVAERVERGQPEWLGQRPDRTTAATAYRYDATGEIVETWDGHKGKTRFDYDPLGQLLARVPERSRAEVFRYDPAGNLREEGPSAEEYTYGPGNRLLRKGSTTYAWDDDGRLVEKRARAPDGGPEQVTRYSWNGSGLLATVDTPDRRRVEFVYDAFARRVKKSVLLRGGPGERPTLISMTRFVWDGDVLVHEITTHVGAAGNERVAVRTFCFADEGFSPLAHQEGLPAADGRPQGEWLHYVNAPMGAPEQLVASDGTVAGALRRSAWGRTDLAEGSRATTPLRFQGQYEDEETGLCYNRFRYYDPDAGRFTSADPLGLDGGLSGYRYAPNPLIWIDPLGLTERNVDPRTIRFSQRTVGPETLDYQADMRNRRWDWDQSGPLRCMEVNGQLVSYDNRRLRAAQNATAQQPTVPVEIVDPRGRAPTGQTWAQAFESRRCDPRNAAAGGAVPPEGLTQQPSIVRPPAGGGRGGRGGGGGGRGRR